ncbi:LPXTG cell wall anchor domain-containing protein [Micromonospora sp. SL4-19]|uniref:LPXTG cell wall anchor domain-containing protein n=1 Tax=Micromonospora sp. SL4-19 TaxID=3399129 RepID=UPI003A4DE39A
MFRNSTRRWLAGLGVAGAFIAASATPAAAAGAPFEVITSNLIVAPGHSTYGFVFAMSADPEHPVSFGRTTLDIDFSGIANFAVPEFEGEGGDWACQTSGTSVHCESDLGRYQEPALGFVVTGKDDAKPGQQGDIVFAVTSGGKKASANATVTLAEAVDLQTEQELTASGDPGAKVGVRPLVRNGSEVTSHGAVMVFSTDYLNQYAGDFSNCDTFGFFGLTVCTFDQELEPGKEYQAAVDVPVRLDKDVRSGARLGAVLSWWTKDDWAVVSEGIPAGEPGKGKELRLVEKAGAKSLRVPQTDPDFDNNWTDVTFTVTGNHPADLSAAGAQASGKKGDVVRVTPSFTNLGPALLEYQDGPLFRVTIPKGTTAVDVSGDCQPYTTDKEWDPWDGLWGEPGAKEYACMASETPKGMKYDYEFSLRIDKVVPNASGAVMVRLPGDPNSKNDSAAIVINPSDGGQGGGGTLPITGSATGLIAGIGALLLAAGVGGFAVARRRKTRFVA